MKTNRTMLFVLKETSKHTDNQHIVKTTVKLHMYGVDETSPNRTEKLLRGAVMLNPEQVGTHCNILFFFHCNIPMKSQEILNSQKILEKDKNG